MSRVRPPTREDDVSHGVRCPKCPRARTEATTEPANAAKTAWRLVCPCGYVWGHVKVPTP